MILNEYGLVLLEIPNSGYDSIRDSILETNLDLKPDDKFHLSVSDYEFVAIVKNPFYRAVEIFNENTKKRKKNKKKTYSFFNYFEKSYNKWDYEENIDDYNTQISHFPENQDVTVFSHHDVVKNWNDVSVFLENSGLKKIKVYNQIENYKDWKKYYSDKESLDIILYIFEDDFSAFKYDTKL